MIDRKKTQYVNLLYVNHNIPSIVQWDPKVSVLFMARKATSGAIYDVRRRVKE